MMLQSEDYDTAYHLQQELARLCPNDQVITEFSDYLPDWVKHQKEEENNEEYYDEEYDEEENAEDAKSSESEKSSEKSEGEYMTKEEEEEEERKLKEKQEKYIQQYGDPGSAYEWDSKVDSNGNPVKEEGEESEESEWYYEEDKLAWENGEYNPIPDLLNKNAQYETKPEDEEQNDKQRTEMSQAVYKVVGKEHKLKKKTKRVGGGH